MQLGRRIIYAWVGEDLAGEQGIVMVLDRNGGILPLVTLDERTARLGARLARKAAKARRSPVRLVRYEETNVIDTVDP